jgi:hypothetical protein
MGLLVGSYFIGRIDFADYQSIDPIAVVSLLFQALNQLQQAVLQSEGEGVQLFEISKGNLTGFAAGQESRHRFAERSQSDLEMLDVFLDRTSTVPFRNVSMD